MRNTIMREALALGLDPRAVLAVAAGEGGLTNRAGDIGDQGRSFGPFQLFEGGALPKKYRGKSQQADAWAWSPAGIRYALGRMASVGAAGLSGPQAVETIIRKFERPANPDASVRNAVGRLDQPGFRPQDMRGRAAQAFAGGPAGIVRGPSPSQFQAFKQQQVAGLLQMSQNTISGDPNANWQIMGQLAQGRRELFAASQQVQAAEGSARQTGGSTVPMGQTFDIADPIMRKILETADAQIGKPYVWGAESPAEGGFDCSGLIDFAYKQAGIRLPGRLTTQAALRQGISVRGKPYQPGDWLITNGGKHMVMYVGNGQVIAAPHRGAVVRYQPVSDFDGDIVDVRRVNVQRAAGRRG
jgi:cell wall-associated NlpC family hydrolase